MPSPIKAPKDPIHVLLASANHSDQALIASQLSAQGFLTKLIITPTAEQMLACLRDSYLAIFNFPRLVLLDADLLERDPEWSLLVAIRSAYPGLPLVLLSADGSPEATTAAYQRGVQALITKADDAQSWARQLDAVLDYWLNTASLPRLLI